MKRTDSLSRHRGRSLAAGALVAVACSLPASAPAAWMRITDPANPIVGLGQVPNGSYAGASWADVNGDGWPDLYPSGRPIFVNQGGGAFVADSTGFPRPATSLGNTWADVDNDGRIDLFQCGPVGKLFRNLGGGSFALVTGGAAGDTTSNRGFAAAFADYDGDGLVDLLTTHFFGGFAGAPTSNQLLHNEGGLVFTRDDTTPATVDTSTYIVPSWIDFDDDGDLDLTVGRGPITTTGPDDFYRNRLTEDGSFSLEKLSTGPLATDARDGQTHAWIDYDNDGDVDCFITNFSGGPTSLPNSLYRNDAGTFVAMDSTQAGRIVVDTQRSTGCCWEDFDNDGWIDCIVSNDQFKRNKYYLNNGDGTFTRTVEAVSNTNGNHYAVVAADYDRDGDQDVFVSGVVASAALFRNDNGSNGNHWLNVQLAGTASNRSAIGAVVRAKATIDGSPQWQRRDLQSQTGSPGMSHLRAAFGLGDATVVDSLVIEWPLSPAQVLTAVAADQFLAVTEGAASSVPSVRAASLRLHAPAPNPFAEATTVSFELTRRDRVEVDVVDVAGRRVRRLLAAVQDVGRHQVSWNGQDDRGQAVAAGVYFVRLRGPGAESSRKLVRVP